MSDAPTTRNPADDVGPRLPDRAGLLAVCGGDAALLDELIGVYLEDVPRVLGRVRSAARGGDRAALREAAHHLTPSLTTSPPPHPPAPPAPLHCLAPHP